jgi:mono/diheme cytochrome c family protein
MARSRTRSTARPDATAALAGVCLIAGLAAACSQGNSADPPAPQQPGMAPPPAPGAPVSTVPDSYLLGPNRILQSDGTFQIDTPEYAQAYYAAIDPLGEKDTLTKWKAANLFDSGTGTQVTVVFGDVRDLGYGRRMTARQNPDGTIAVYVDNYVVSPVVEYEYSSLNLEAAIVQDPPWRIGTSAMEFSAGPGGGASFAKFFWFDAQTGERELEADADGRGAHAMPSVCIGCHGGRQDPLTPPDAAGSPLFPRVANSTSMARGDVQAWFMPLDVEHLDFSTTPGFTRADQEAALKTLNRMVLCTYPLPAPSAFPEDACRRAATPVEWAGTAAALIKAGYGGDGLPQAVYANAFVPSGWAGEAALYRDVVAPFCRTCHLLRGTAAQSDIDLDSFAKFQAYADRIKAHVIDRGDMPHALLIYDAFWDGGGPEVLASFLEDEDFTVRDPAGAVLRPGRPIAIPGPDRVIRRGATTLSGAASLFSSSYAWSIVSGPDGATPPSGATLINPTSATPVFDASLDGAFVVELVTANGGPSSAPARVTLVVDDALSPAPSAIRFADVKAALQGGGCAGCHFAGGGTPLVLADVDRNGDAVVDATDDRWFYEETRGRINFTDIVSSRLLGKPAGIHHAGGQLPGFDVAAAPGEAARASYDRLLNWILNGAPQ